MPKNSEVLLYSSQTTARGQGPISMFLRELQGFARKLKWAGGPGGGADKRGARPAGTTSRRVTENAAERLCEMVG